MVGFLAFELNWSWCLYFLLQTTRAEGQTAGPAQLGANTDGMPSHKVDCFSHVSTVWLIVTSVFKLIEM